MLLPAIGWTVIGHDWNLYIAFRGCFEGQDRIVSSNHQPNPRSFDSHKAMWNHLQGRHGLIHTGLPGRELRGNLTSCMR
jgi:hypothetical protein